MHHNDARGWEWGVGVAITNKVLKFGKVTEFESSCIVVCFSCIYLIIDGKDHLSIKKEV